jgi:serine/threonine protein kinase/beta-lactam-binding protein with PASTA domain
VIGNKLGGRYEILDRIGGGGMAVVYKAKDLLLHRIVAVKVLRPQYAIDDDFVHRFRREAQAAASLSHPNVVSIYDVGVEGDIHYIIMEYVEGSTLKEYITNFAPLPIDEAIQLTKQIAEALDHAHHNQIIHRDIKPHNILIGKNQKVKVTDFGIARAVTSSTITHTGSVLGSVHYFSPEQARGGLTGEKSDIYSLGIVLYEMLTGKLPFSGDSPISVALKHLQESYTEPRLLNDKIPQSVENIILRSLAKDPLQRYSSAKELIKDLDTCLDMNRMSEKKHIVPQMDDEEATKVIPVINESMFDTKVAKTRSQIEEEDEDWEEEEERSKGAIWVKLGLSLVLILLLGFGVYQGYNYVTQLFYVQDIEVEDVIHLPVDEARSILVDQGLRVDTSREVTSAEVKEGHIISQFPVAGSPVKENTSVRLTVSLGKEKERMRSLIDLHESTANRLLVNYADVVIVEEENDLVPAGHVIRQDPQADQMVIPDETIVTLFVSSGKGKFEMPNLIGLSQTEAEAILDRHNLILERIEEDFGDVPEGEVYRQHPVDPGQEVEAGTQITIWVSKGFKELTREKTAQITVTVEEDERAKVVIFVTDINGVDQQVINQEIDQTETFSVKVNVSREQDATIKVFKDSSLYEQPRTITFE